MAITRSQQARQMLKKGTKPIIQGGVKNYLGKQQQVKAPLKWQSSPDHPTTELAYITKAEKDLLVKSDLHGSLKGGVNKGPSGIMSLNGYGSKDAAGNEVGMSGAATSDAEAGRSTANTRAEGPGRNLPPGVRDKGLDDYRSSFIAAGGGQRVNPGFFDSRNTVSPAELARAKAFAPGAFAKSRGSGFMNFLTGGGITGALLRGLGQRFGFGKRFNEPTYDMSKFNNLSLFGDVPEDFEDDPKISLTSFSKLPEVTVTPFQEDVIQTAKLDNLGLIQMRNLEKKKGMEEYGGAPFTDEDRQMLEELKRRDADPNKTYGPVLAADGGLMGGGIMDAAGRQGYFFGKLVKKITRPLKKIIKSPVGKLGLGALLLGTGGAGGGIGGFLKNKALPFMLKNKGLTAAAALTAAPFLFQKDTNDEDYEQFLSQQGSYGKGIDIAGIRNNPYDYLARSFRAEGGSMKEPVAKKTMPLLNMGGMEKDYRADGGFVPIGRMEKADDVPARLSKNEFVFTADAVRNAGDGDIDKGAEVMYNMMKNLEAGGEVSEESQGREGARKMFQTSQRLEEVL
jgi:hypothetical protein